MKGMNMKSKMWMAVGCFGASLIAGGCSSGSKSNQWSGGGDTYGDGVSGLQETSPATSYWSDSSAVTVKVVNSTNGALKVEPYEATAGGELLMPLAEFIWWARGWRTAAGFGCPVNRSRIIR